MSAFQQSEYHIGALLRWYHLTQRRSGPPAPPEGLPRTPEANFGVLAVANVESLDARYPSESWTPVIRTRPLLAYAALTPVEVVMACHGYEYQACEYAEWDQSEAKQLIAFILHEADANIPGYGDAETWSIDEAWTDKRNDGMGEGDRGQLISGLAKAIEDRAREGGPSL